jgi:hypothetical protein
LDPFLREEKGKQPRIGDEALSISRDSIERIDNNFQTATENRNKAVDPEELHSRKKRAARKLSAAKEKLMKLLEKYEGTFVGDGGLPTKVPGNIVKHAIKLKEGQELGRSPGMRTRSKQDTEFIEKQIADLLEADLIFEVKGPVAFASQVHVVKSAGRDRRFTVDYRQINELTEGDAFPLPRMDQLLQSFGGARIFSTLDACKGFWQVRMGEGRELTAFRVNGKVYVWKLKVMPMGLKNAPATFQRFMESILGDLPFVRVYIDDIIIASRSLTEHLVHIEKVLSRCSNNSVRLKSSKCHFLRSQLKVLGY